MVFFGHKYYIKEFDEDFAFKSIISINNTKLNNIYKMLKLKNVKDSKKVFLEVVIPMILKKIGKDNLSTYVDAILSLLEYAAERLEINQFEIYNIEEFFKVVKERIIKLDKTRKIHKIDEVIYNIIDSIELS